MNMLRSLHVTKFATAKAFKEAISTFKSADKRQLQSHGNRIVKFVVLVGFRKFIFSAVTNYRLYE